jgi:hypothetical protein
MAVIVSVSVSVAMVVRVPVVVTFVALDADAVVGVRGGGARAVRVPARWVVDMAVGVVMLIAMLVGVFERVQLVVQRVINDLEGDRIQDRKQARRQGRLQGGCLDGRGRDAVTEQGEGLIEEGGRDRVPVEVLGTCCVGGSGHRGCLWAATSGDTLNDIAGGVSGFPQKRVLHPTSSHPGQLGQRLWR